MKVFCKEQLEKQTVVHGMEMAHEDVCSVRAGGSLGAHQGLAGSLPGSCWELARSSPALGKVGVFLRKQTPWRMVWNGETRVLSWAGRLHGVLCSGTPAGLSANAMAV